MADEAQTVEGEVEDLTPDAIEESMPQSAELAVRDPDDEQEVFRVLDAHDEAMILQEAQQRLLKKSLYDFPQGGSRVVDLSYWGVLELVRLMNATGKVKIAVDPASLVVEREEHDGVAMIVATVYGRDTVTGYGVFGTSSEPERMRLTDSKADEYRRDGKGVGPDNTVFDRYARSKAVNKAQRNALKGFIPETVKQTLIAQYMGDSRRIERIQTRTEQRLLEAPPALDTPEAKELIARCRELYAEIREVAGGRGKTKLPPGEFNAYLTAVHHDVDRLRDFVAHLEDRKEKIPQELAAQDRQAEAMESVTKVACPACEQPKGKFCKGIRGAHPERVRARLAEIEAAS